MAGIFLKLLIPQQDSLTKLVRADLRERNLSSQQAKTALATLESGLDRALRVVANVLVSKGLYLFWWIIKHKYIAGSKEFRSLMQEASDVITSLGVDDSILELAGISQEEANAAGCVNG